jgi:hypothetical protein
VAGSGISQSGGSRSLAVGGGGNCNYDLRPSLRFRSQISGPLDETK